MSISHLSISQESQSLEKENSLLRNKIHMLEQNRKPSELTLINKELYLNYMQQVLNYKQKQLIKMEKRVQDKQLDLINRQAYMKLLSPLEKSTDIDVFIKKLGQVKRILNNNQTQIRLNDSFEREEWTRFMSKQQEILDQCRNYQRQTQELIKTEYQNLIRQRKQLAESMDKFQQLNSYEKYLNQLQTILQAREKQILHKQDLLYSQEQSLRYQVQMQPPTTISFGNRQHETHPMNNQSTNSFSQKKRLKIFQSANKSNLKKPIPNYGGYQSKGSLGQNDFSHHENGENSSFIMQQADNNESDTLKKFKIYNNRPERYQTQKTPYQTPVTHIMPVKPVTESLGVQANIEFLTQSLERLQKQKKVHKFLSLWVKHSISSKKSSAVGYRKTLGLYLWRLNTMYNTQLPSHVKQIYFSQWPQAYNSSLKSQQLYPYNQLSLNRKRYCEATLDYERKLVHKKHIAQSLKNIILRKSIKQRTIFACYFKKLIQNFKLMTIIQYQRQLKNQVKSSLLKDGNTTTNLNTTAKHNIESRYISGNSSRIMIQQQQGWGVSSRNKLKQMRDIKQNKKVGNLSQYPNKSMSTANILSSTSPTGKSPIKMTKQMTKQNVNPSSRSMNESLDIKKLKEYIKSQEQAQKSLAVQCVKTQSICMLTQCLGSLVNRLVIPSFYEIKNISENQRLAELQHRIGKHQFHWQLFMTKCKLALVNNNNKIGHLEETLGWMMGGTK